MTPFLQTTFMQALGFAIINSLWQFSLLWLVYVFINSFCRFTAHQKYAAGVVLQFAGFIWFSGTLIFYSNTLASTSCLTLFQENHDSIFSAGGTAKEKFFIAIPNLQRWLSLLSAGYILLLLLLTLRWMNSYRQAQVMRTTALQKTSVEWRLFVHRMSQHFGIKRKVGIFISTKITTPLTVGFFKPLILLPLAAINNLAVEQMEAIVLHELAHIKRSDYLVNLFLSVIETMLFFNPFMHLLSRHIKRERENCCDDWVLQFEYNPASYAQALLHIVKYQTFASALALHAAKDNKHVLLNRIKRIIEKKEKALFNFRHQLVAVLVTSTLLGMVMLMSPAYQGIDSAVNSNPLLQPLSAKVNNPLFSSETFLASSPGKPEAKKSSSLALNKEEEAMAYNDVFANDGGRKNAATMQSSHRLKMKSSDRVIVKNDKRITMLTAKVDNAMRQWNKATKEEALNDKDKNKETDADPENVRIQVPQLKELTAQQFEDLVKKIKLAIGTSKQKEVFKNSAVNVDFKIEAPGSDYASLLENAVFNDEAGDDRVQDVQSSSVKHKSHTIIIIVTEDEDAYQSLQTPASAKPVAKCKKTIRI